MKRTAKGSFEVELTAEKGTPELGRSRLFKRFTGDLVAEARGEMLSWRDEATGAAAYVALDRVSGTLAGRPGSFTLTHVGTMTGKAQALEVRVVPGSATDGLVGLTGTLSITITGGRHDYELAYELPDISRPPRARCAQPALDLLSRAPHPSARITQRASRGAGVGRGRKAPAAPPGRGKKGVDGGRRPVPPPRPPPRTKPSSPAPPRRGG